MRDLIDVHIHHYPENAQQDPKVWAEVRGELYWGDLVTNGPQGWASGSKLIADMDAAGCRHAIMQGWYWEHNRTCLEQNAFLTQVARESKGRLLAMVSINPSEGLESSLEVLEASAAKGAIGIGELHPGVQRFSLRSDLWFGICEWAANHDWPILLHVTEPVGHLYKGRVETPLADYVWMAKQCPKNRFILAHWGGGLPFYMLNREVKKALQNVWFDTAASPLVYRKDVWQVVLKLIGPERIVFGSDYPLRMYPKLYDEPEMNQLVKEGLACIGSEEAQMQIFAENARRLFRI